MQVMIDKLCFFPSAAAATWPPPNATTQIITSINQKAKRVWLPTSLPVYSAVLRIFGKARISVKISSRCCGISVFSKVAYEAIWSATRTGGYGRAAGPPFPDRFGWGGVRIIAPPPSAKYSPGPWRWVLGHWLLLPPSPLTLRCPAVGKKKTRLFLF